MQHGEIRQNPKVFCWLVIQVHTHTYLNNAKFIAPPPAPTLTAQLLYNRQGANAEEGGGFGGIVFIESVCFSQPLRLGVNRALKIGL